MTDISLAPWLLEESNKYLQAATVLKNHNTLLSVAELNAALSIEILLKSFLVKPVENLGSAYEKYEYRNPKGMKPHNLCHLYEQLPKEVKESLFDEQLVTFLVDFSDVFTHSRYKYEATSRRSYSSTLIKVAEELTPKAIRFYRDHGCRDPWILSYPVRKLC
ncbi:hypothetical protein JHS3_01560 [Jeongeupia sp. HS-3]|uniref:hypothetical protein n=1 Tax=Jeongeupia sp. HS-3 TaxID=1009682 RepID=UPI0018A60EE6|nr:hypothetical protein [Jeongeupia sp. HS-3]BCL74420.1 hypothetical protein JHS3_01560 [Jeongeupia sp. HS-3]